MVIDGEALQAFCAGVDQPQPMCLAACELELGYAGVGRTSRAASRNFTAVEIHFAVDQIVVRQRRRLIYTHDLFDNIKVLGVKPV